MPLNDDILNSIMSLLCIGHPAKNSTCVCGITISGSCTQSFVNQSELTEHIQVVLITSPLSRKTQQVKTITDMSQHDHLGLLIIGQQPYEVFNQPADNSCFFIRLVPCYIPTAEHTRGCRVKLN